MSALTVGKVAAEAGVNIETLRYYERKGILPEPPRSPSSYRLYPEDTVRRVRFVKRAQELGFTLKEVKEILSLRVTRGARCRDVQQQAEVKIQEIDQKIRALQAMQNVLQQLVQQCSSGTASMTECPILKCLDSNGKM